MIFKRQRDCYAEVNAFSKFTEHRTRREKAFNYYKILTECLAEDKGQHASF